jgi:uncharacterized protein
MAEGERDRIVPGSFNDRIACYRFKYRPHPSRATTLPRRGLAPCSSSGSVVSYDMDPSDAALAFGPQATLAGHLLAALPVGSDGSHDLSHILRVWRNAASIARDEPACDLALLAAAVILHDCVAVEKDSPQRAVASRLSAARARDIVADIGWTPSQAAALAHAIEAHSFSAGIEPDSLEARILQDADRLDAIGAIGIARCFYVGGRMTSALYEPNDPAGERRALDDRHYALDHFGAKLFKLASRFRTASGQAMAAQRAETMRAFVAAFLAEIAADAAANEPVQLQSTEEPP